MALATRHYPPDVVELVMKVFPGNMLLLRAVRSGERSAVGTIQLLGSQLQTSWSADELWQHFRGLSASQVAPYVKSLRTAAERAVLYEELRTKIGELLEAEKQAVSEPLCVSDG